MAQSVKHLTLDFGSGHDFTVCELEPPVWGSARSVQSLLGILSLSLSLCPSLTHSLCLSLKITK